MAEQNQCLTLTRRLHLCPWCARPSVDLVALMRGRRCRRKASPLRGMSSVKRCSLCSSCLCCLAVACGTSSSLPCGKYYTLRLLASQTNVLSHLRRLPSQQEKLFSPHTSFLGVLVTFHCTFTDSTLVFCLINNNAKPFTDTKLSYICVWCNVLMSPELR